MQPITSPPYTIRMKPDLEIGKKQFVLIAGPCVVESEALVMETAGFLKSLTQSLGIPFIFKASFDKANRTSGESFRSIGIETSLEILNTVRTNLSLPVLTDVHESPHVQQVANAVDILQIPAFLCRQTDLLVACGKTGLPVNVKKGQFMAPEDMKNVVEKIHQTGNPNVILTERGTSFGYHNLVVDMRSLPIMRQYTPVIFDATHSVQQPGGLGNSSGGQRQFVPYLARAAAAVGVDGFFIETHPEPANALSDGPNMIPLNEMKVLLESLQQICSVA